MKAATSAEVQDFGSGEIFFMTKRRKASPSIATATPAATAARKPLKAGSAGPRIGFRKGRPKPLRKWSSVSKPKITKPKKTIACRKPTTGRSPITFFCRTTSSKKRRRRSPRRSSRGRSLLPARALAIRAPASRAKMAIESATRRASSAFSQSANSSACVGIEANAIRNRRALDTPPGAAGRSPAKPTHPWPTEIPPCAARSPPSPSRSPRCRQPPTVRRPSTTCSPTLSTGGRARPPGAPTAPG